MREITKETLKEFLKKGYLFAPLSRYLGFRCFIQDFPRDFPNSTFPIYLVYHRFCISSASFVSLFIRKSWGIMLVLKYQSFLADFGFVNGEINLKCPLKNKPLVALLFLSSSLFLIILKKTFFSKAK